MLDTGNPPQRIDRYEIRSFVNNYVRWLEEEDLDAIIRRCDTDGDELLVFSEFDDAVKITKPVRTIPHLEETFIKPPRFGADMIEEVHYHPPPILDPQYIPPPVVKEVIHKEITPYRTTMRSTSPARSVSPARVVRTTHVVPEVEENKYEPVRTVKYEPKAHSPPRLSEKHFSSTAYTTPPRMSIHRPTLYRQNVRRASPLRGYEENELAESFKDLIALEGELEVSKQALALRPDFTLNDAFKMFDLGLSGHITDYDIKAVFEMHGIFITLEEAKLLLSRYDRDLDGVLRFDELIDMFLPKDLVTSDALADRSAMYPSGYYTVASIPDPVTKNDFTHVLALNVKVENHVESIRQKHSERPLFNAVDAYDALNKYGNVALTRDDFGILLANHRFFPTNNELETLVDRFDKTKNGRVTYGEFINEITPHSPKRF